MRSIAGVVSGGKPLNETILQRAQICVVETVECLGVRAGTSETSIEPQLRTTQLNAMRSLSVPDPGQSKGRMMQDAVIDHALRHAPLQLA